MSVIFINSNDSVEYFQCRYCFGPLPQDVIHHFSGFCSEECAIHWRILRYGTPVGIYNRPVFKKPKLAVAVEGQSPTGKKAPNVH